MGHGGFFFWGCVYGYAEGQRVASKLVWLMASYNIFSSVVKSLHVDDMTTVRTMAYNVSSPFF